MKNIQIGFPEELLLHLRMSNTEFSQEMKKMALLKIYELGKISSGKAAILLGISKVAFVELLHQYKVSIFNDEEQYLEDDIENALNVGKFKNTEQSSVATPVDNYKKP